MNAERPIRRSDDPHSSSSSSSPSSLLVLGGRPFSASATRPTLAASAGREERFDPLQLLSHLVLHTNVVNQLYPDADILPGADKRSSGGPLRAPAMKATKREQEHDNTTAAVGEQITKNRRSDSLIDGDTECFVNTMASNPTTTTTRMSVSALVQRRNPYLDAFFNHDASFIESLPFHLSDNEELLHHGDHRHAALYSSRVSRSRCHSGGEEDGATEKSLPTPPVSYAQTTDSNGSDGANAHPGHSHAVEAAAYYVCEARERAVWAQVCQEVLYTQKMCEAQSIAVSRHHRLMLDGSAGQQENEEEKEKQNIKIGSKSDAAASNHHAKLLEADVSAVDEWLKSVDDKWMRERTRRDAQNDNTSVPKKAGSLFHTSTTRVVRPPPNRGGSTAAASWSTPCSIGRYREAMGAEVRRLHLAWLEEKYSPCSPFLHQGGKHHHARSLQHSFHPLCEQAIMNSPSECLNTITTTTSREEEEESAVQPLVRTAPETRSTIITSETTPFMSSSDALLRRRCDELLGRVSDEKLFHQEKEEGGRKRKRDRSQSPGGGDRTLQNTMMKATMSCDGAASSSATAGLHSSARERTLLQRLLYYRAVLHRREVPIVHWAGRERFLPLSAAISYRSAMGQQAHEDARSTSTWWMSSLLSSSPSSCSTTSFVFPNKATSPRTRSVPVSDGMEVKAAPPLENLPSARTAANDDSTHSEGLKDFSTTNLQRAPPSSSSSSSFLGLYYDPRGKAHRRRLLSFCPPRDTQPWRYQPALCADLTVYWKLHRDAEARARLVALKNRDADAFAEHVSFIQIAALLKIMEHTHAFMHRIGQRIAARAEAEKQRREREEEEIVLALAATANHHHHHHSSSSPSIPLTSNGMVQQKEGLLLAASSPLPTGSPVSSPPPTSSVMPELLPSTSGEGSSGSTNLSAAYHRFKAYMHSTKDEFRLVHVVDAAVDAAPRALRATLLPHQMDGLRFLSSLHANRINGILADEMGVGKTIQTIAFLLYLRELAQKKMERRAALLEESGLGRGQLSMPSSLSCTLTPSSATHRPHLVLAPLSVVREWADACETFIEPGMFRVGEFMQLREDDDDTEDSEENEDDEEEEERKKMESTASNGSHSDSGKTQDKTRNRKRTGPPLSIVEQAKTYDLLLLPIHSVRYRLQELVQVDWDYIVVDEAHKAVSNLETLTARSIMQLPFQRRLVLTGTPLSSDLKELWSLLYFLNPDVFSDKDSFDEVFLEPFKMYQCKEVRLADEHQELLVLRLHQILRPFMLRRTKKDVCQTLHMTFHELTCPMTAMQQGLLSLLRERRRLPYYHAVEEVDDKSTSDEDRTSDNSSSDSESEDNRSPNNNKNKKKKTTPIKNQNNKLGRQDEDEEQGKTITKQSKDAAARNPSRPQRPSAPRHSRNDDEEEDEEEGEGGVGAAFTRQNIANPMTNPQLPAQDQETFSKPVASDTGLLNDARDGTSLAVSTYPTTASFRCNAENIGLTSLNVSESTAQAICNHAFMHNFFPQVLQNGYGLKSHKLGPTLPSNEPIAPAANHVTTTKEQPKEDEGAPKDDTTSLSTAQEEHNISICYEEKRSDDHHQDVTASSSPLRPDESTPRGDSTPTLRNELDPAGDHTDRAGAAELVLASSGKFLFLHLFLRRVVTAGRKAVIFTHWLQCMDLLADYFAGQGWGHRVEMLSGATSEEERKQRVRRFHDDPTCSFFVVSMKAGGCGINLQCAHLILLLDRDYTTTNEDQALARVYRIGQRHTVRAITLTTGDPTERKVVERAQWKNKPRQAIIEEGQYFVKEEEEENEEDMNNKDDVNGNSTNKGEEEAEKNRKVVTLEKNEEDEQGAHEVAAASGGGGGGDVAAAASEDFTSASVHHLSASSSRRPASSLSLQPVWQHLTNQRSESRNFHESSSAFTVNPLQEVKPPQQHVSITTTTTDTITPFSTGPSMTALAEQFGDSGWAALRSLVVDIDRLVLTDEDLRTHPEVCAALQSQLPPASVADYLHAMNGNPVVSSISDSTTTTTTTANTGVQMQMKENARCWAGLIALLMTAIEGPALLQHALAMAMQAETRREDPEYCRLEKERRWAAKAERLRLLQLEPPQSFYELCWDKGLTEDMDIRRRFAKMERRAQEEKEMKRSKTASGRLVTSRIKG